MLAAWHSMPPSSPAASPVSADGTSEVKITQQPSRKEKIGEQRKLGGVKEETNSSKKKMNHRTGRVMEKYVTLYCFVIVDVQLKAGSSLHSFQDRLTCFIQCLHALIQCRGALTTKFFFGISRDVAESLSNCLKILVFDL